MKIFDNSALILFLEYIEEEKCLHLLSESGEYLVVPESVCKEFGPKDFDGKLDDSIEKSILKKFEGMSKSIEQNIRNRFPTLHDGEINVLAWGTHLKKENKNFWCVLDELDGRKAAKKLDLPIKGSIGLLKILKDKNIINKSQLEIISDKIKDSPFFIKEEILRELLNG